MSNKIVHTRRSGPSSLDQGVGVQPSHPGSHGHELGFLYLKTQFFGLPYQFTFKNMYTPFREMIHATSKS